MRPLERKLLKFSAFLGLFFLVASILMPAFACGCKIVSPAMTCMRRLKQQAKGLLLYAADHDDRLAARDVWIDAIQPYVESEKVFHDPEGPKDSYGYAFNSKLAFAALPKQGESVPIVYDSVNPIRNASDPFVSLPSPGRHKGKNAIAYADGHARLVPAEKQP